MFASFRNLFKSTRQTQANEIDPDTLATIEELTRIPEVDARFADIVTPILPPITVTDAEIVNEDQVDVTGEDVIMALPMPRITCNEFANAHAPDLVAAFNDKFAALNVEYDQSPYASLLKTNAFILDILGCVIELQQPNGQYELAARALSASWSQQSRSDIKNILALDQYFINEAHVDTCSDSTIYSLLLKVGGVCNVSTQRNNFEGMYDFFDVEHVDLSNVQWHTTSFLTALVDTVEHFMETVY